MTAQKKILFYYHHFGGLGHGSRIYAMCKALRQIDKNIKTVVLNSGTPQPELNIEKFATLINLPYLKTKRGLFSGLQAEGDLKSTFEKRRKIIALIMRNIRFDIAVFEHYPFGRDSLHNEISHMTNILEKQNAAIYSSIRDIIVNDTPRSIVIERLKSFQAVFVHSDPQMGLKANFELSDPIKEKIIYTNRVFSASVSELTTKRKILEKLNCTKKRLIVINFGGGIDGKTVISSLLSKMFSIKDAVDKVTKTMYLISTGPSIDDDVFERLTESVNNKDIIIKKFIDDMPSYVKAAQIYLTMGGYNSINNALVTKTKALVFPRESDPEQKIRADYFKGFFKVSSFNATKSTLTKEITGLLKIKDSKKKRGGYPKFNGAEVTARLLERSLNLKYIKLRLTTRCNCHCDMCSWKSLHQELPYFKIRQLVKHAKLINVKVLNFTGGEPTLYPYFFELIRFAKNEGFSVSVSSNGVLERDKIKKLTGCVDFMDISINSHLPEIDDRIRGKKDALRSTFLTIDLLGKINKDIKLHINVTVRPDNFFDIHKIVNVLPQNVSSVSFTLVDTSINNLVHLNFKKVELINFYNYGVPNILKECFKQHIDVRIKPFLNNSQTIQWKDIPKLQSIDKIDDLKTYFLPHSPAVCLRPKEELRINADGNISPCCYLDDYPADLGNILRDDLLTIISSTKYHNFLSDVEARKKWCNKCQLGYLKYAAYFK